MENQIQRAADIVLNGGVIAYPTDTVYGLGADPYNERAVKRIYEIKNRPFDQPFPLLIAQMSDVLQLTSDFTDKAARLAAHFWPGGLTIVLTRSSFVPDWITAGGDSIAVRIPNHPLTLALIRAIGKPLVGTSANVSGQASAIISSDVRTGLENSIDFILDGGMCPGGIESTVVDVTGSTPVIVREGAISSAVIMEMIST